MEVDLKFPLGGNTEQLNGAPSCISPSDCKVRLSYNKQCQSFFLIFLFAHAFPGEPCGFKSQVPWIHRPKANQYAPLQLVPYNPEGWGGGALKERFGRGVSPRPSNPDSVFKAAHD